MSFLDNLPVLRHVAIVHFPIVSILMALAAAVTALGLGIFSDTLRKSNRLHSAREELLGRYIERFEFLSFALIVLGEISLIIAAISGIQTAGDAETAINDEILEFKIRLSILLFFVMLTPIIQKSYFGISKRTHVFGTKSRVIPLLYIGPLIISAFLTLLISSAGDQYNNGINLFNNIGLGWLIPT